MICIIFILGFVLSLNMKLIGGKASTMGVISLLGYACAPMVIAAIVVLVLINVNKTANWVNVLVSALVAGVCAFWCLLATMNFFKGIAPQGRVTLAVYPVVFYFVTIGMLTVLPSISTFKGDIDL